MTNDEQAKLAVTALLDDFKARWQELLNFEHEVSRWSTLYVTAVLLVISWVLSNERYADLDDLFSREFNPYFILLLAVVNALYTLAMAVKGYQIQQIGLYIDSQIAPRIHNLTGEPFNTWERWRRDTFQHKKRSSTAASGTARTGKPEPLRIIYYTAISGLPILVSVVILGMYLYFVSPDATPWQAKNLALYVAIALIYVAGRTASSTTTMNRLWEEHFLAMDAGTREPPTGSGGPTAPIDD